MKRFLTSLFLLLAFAVSAQTMAPVPSVTPAPVLKPTPISPPSCYPLVNGKHAGIPRHVNGEVGQHVFWFCVDSAGWVEGAGVSCIHGECLASAAAAAQTAVITATAKVRTAKEQYEKYVQFECGAFEQAEVSKRGDLCRERVRIYNAMVYSWLGLKPPN